MTTRLIGLTGGIGAGKTTISNYLANTYNLPIFDADIYAREAVQPDSTIWRNIVERYGREILQADHHLNRKQLGKIIFENPQERQWLENQIHPYVRERFTHATQPWKDQDIPNDTTPSLPAVLVIPLLFEAQMTDLVTEIWVVACPQEQQVQRLMERDTLTAEQARLRIQNQMPLAQKCQQADVVLENTGSLDILLRQVDQALGLSCKESLR